MRVNETLPLWQRIVTFRMDIPRHWKHIAEMKKPDAPIRFEVKLLRPAIPGEDRSWSFLILPKTASEPLPRRGRTTVAGTLNGHPFQATLEPDGNLSHWLKVGKHLREAANAADGDMMALAITPVVPEPDPPVPQDFREALAQCPQAGETWMATTTVARLDWIHWIDSAKQQTTRERRIRGACEMLAAGTRRVCCFDPSGYYSKGFNAPEAAD